MALGVTLTLPKLYPKVFQRANKWLSGEVFVIARLFANENDFGALASSSKTACVPIFERGCALHPAAADRGFSNLENPTIGEMSETKAAVF